MSTRYTIVASPLGSLLLTSDGTALTGLSIGGRPEPGWTCDGDEVLARARVQLAEYFAGARDRFDLPLAPAGTPFQRRVWAALVEIPRGATASYAEVARRIGCPGGARAVGQAAGANPLLVVVPCHRVVAAQAIGGFSAGLAHKRRLLGLEGALKIRREKHPPALEVFRTVALRRSSKQGEPLARRAQRARELPLYDPPCGGDR
jgi:methylated-DNA-[protein]-cysteine S-methyltransferase